MEGRREGEGRYPQDQAARLERDLPRNFMDATPSILAEPKKVFSSSSLGGLESCRLQESYLNCNLCKLFSHNQTIC